MYILAIAMHIQYFLKFSKLYKQFHAKKMQKNMDITTKNAKFQEKSMILLDYLLRIQKAHDIFNIGLDSFINVHMSRKN